MPLNRRRTTPRFFIGLDLSLTGTGIIVLDANDVVCFQTTLKNKLRGMERLQFLKNEVGILFSKFPNCEVCIENYAMGIRAGQSFSIGELGGVIKLLLFHLGVHYYLVSPTRLKKYITGSGKADKDMILLQVFKKWGFEAKTSDEADAYGLAKIAQAIHHPLAKYLKYEEEVIQDTLNPPEPKKKRK